MQELSDKLATYIAHRMPAARAVRVDRLERIHGGASRETYRFRLHYAAAGAEVERGLILRRDPPGSLIETERANEFNAYRAFHGTAVPVPEPLWLEEDAAWLDFPFFIMEELRGFQSQAQALMSPPYSEHLDELALRKWTILAEIAKADPQALGLTERMPIPALDACWRRELDSWERVIDEDEMNPQPIARAAIRWLRRHPPPPAQKLSVVHGDYRTGNFLYDDRGEIHAILDWEMAHLGDPLEDLAWGINRVWCWGRDERVGGLVEKSRAIAIWEAASGLRADPTALRWWELFSSVKGQAIWISSAQEYQRGKNQDPVLAVSGWWLMNAQDRAALETLGVLR